MSDQKSGCPDFDLAPLQSFPARVFGQPGHEKVDAFVIALALAFNDLKGMSWLVKQMKKCSPDTTAINPECGEWTGMRLQATRLTLLTVHETLKAISTADGNGVLQDRDLVAAVSRLDGWAADGWVELVSLARNTESDSPVRNYVMRVRHNFSAHYYQPTDLLKGYQKFFWERETDPYNETGQMSLGDAVKHTRFYFADAAVQSGQKLLDPDDALLKEVDQYVLRMFRALSGLIAAYIEVKTKALASAGGA